MEIRGARRARDRRTVEITYVVVSSVVLFAILAIGYKLLLGHFDGEWLAVLSAMKLPGTGLVGALLLVRAVRLLRQLEVDLRTRSSANGS